MQPLLAPFELHLKENLTGEQWRCSRTFKEKPYKLSCLYWLDRSTSKGVICFMKAF